MTTPVADAAEVAKIADAIARAELVAFDLEFLSADRLVPVLCLVQLAWHSRWDAAAPRIDAPEMAIVDPLAVDAAPIAAALAAHPRAIVHAGRQDLALLAARFGVEMLRTTDTQVMAAFAGVGDQVGLATLAQELVGAKLAKEQQWTDWSRRPLTDAQLAYAEADVRWLPAIYARLAAKLGERLAWAEAESAQVAADALAAARVTPETAWRELGTRGLDAPQLAAVIALAAWRQRAAIAADKPLGQVLADKAILEIARAGDVRGTKGLNGFARQRTDEIAAVLAAANPDDAAALVRDRGRPASARAQRWGDLLLQVAQLVAEKAGVAVRLLATRSDAEEFARAFDERGLAGAGALPALATWRRGVIGDVWVAFLEGRVALAGDPASPQGVALVAR